MLGALQAKQKLNLRSIGLLITSFTVLIVLGRAIVGEIGLVAVLNASWTPEALGAFLFALPLVGYATVGLGVAVFVYYGFRTHFQVDRFAVKKQFKKTFVIASLVFCGLFLSSLVTTPLVSAGTTATTGYYLATPYSPFDWLVGKYSTGSVYAINGSNWANLMTFPATTWAAYADNASKVQELVLAATTAGTVYLKEVAFDYDCTIPDNVQVIENLNGLTRVFVDDSESQGSPYTVSVDTVNPTFYTVQDCADRYIISWTSTNASYVINTAIDNCGNNALIDIQGLVYIDSKIDVNVTTHPRMSLTFKELWQTSTSEPAIYIHGLGTQWFGSVKGDYIHTPINYDSAAVMVQGTVGGDIDVNTIWCDTGSAITGYGAYLYGNNDGTDLSVYYLRARFGLIGNFNQGIRIESNSTGYVNHNYFYDTVIQKFKTGIRLDDNGANTGYNSFINVRVDGSGNSANSPYKGWVFEDAKNFMTDSGTLDFDVASTDLELASGASIYTSGTFFSQSNIVNSGIIYGTNYGNTRSVYLPFINGTEIYNTFDYTGYRIDADGELAYCSWRAPDDLLAVQSAKLCYLALGNVTDMVVNVDCYFSASGELKSANSDTASVTQTTVTSTVYEGSIINAFTNFAAADNIGLRVVRPASGNTNIQAQGIYITYSYSPTTV